MTDRVKGLLDKEGASRGTCDFPAWLQKAEPFTALVVRTPKPERPLPKASLSPTVLRVGQRCGLESHHPWGCFHCPLGLTRLRKSFL